ncbi:response regulator [Microbacterium suwonense]|uniref:DNA-binding response regulator n=1 Tax=Microbacterium suwonense TaxID=683047 RepID=A0ABN6X4T5_9MICO|nr:response regulator transcription factor [Microbacterium suwonense]BDZ39697.1 DNA-binding response regulator [Microbacterium suwonense]
MIRVLLVDDEQIVREGIRDILESADDIIVIGELDSGKNIREAVHSTDPDVVLVDLAMPEVNGVQTLSLLQHVERRPASIVLTTFSADVNILAALHRGAVGFLPKSASTESLIATVRSAAAGVSVLPVDTLRTLIPQITAAKGFHDSNLFDRLSARERQIADGVANGANNASIAAQTHLDERTVRSYISRILRRLELENRVQLALLWERSRSRL